MCVYVRADVCSHIAAHAQLYSSTPMLASVCMCEMTASAGEGHQEEGQLSH